MFAHGVCGGVARRTKRCVNALRWWQALVQAEHDINILLQDVALHCCFRIGLARTGGEKRAFFTVGVALGGLGCRVLKDKFHCCSMQHQ